VPEFGLVVVAHRLLERDGGLRAPPDVLDLVGGHLDIPRNLLDGRLAAPLGAQLPLGAEDPVELLDDVHRHPDRSTLVRDRPCDRLADPPRRVRRELEPFAMVEFLRCADQPDRPFLNEVEEREALVPVPLRNRDDEAKIRLHHRLLGSVVATFDALCELHLLRRGQERDASDVLQEELKRIGRDLGVRLGLALDLLLGGDDRDLRLVECRVELVELARLQIELVERERDLVGIELPGLATDLEQPLSFVGREDVLDRCSNRRTFRFYCQTIPRSSSRVTP
jgi:hypothetical protein